MTDESLKYISDTLESAGINYEFGEYTSELQYPYFVGEYAETDVENEDGMQETALILSGFSRDSWLTLEKAKKTIKKLFPPIEGRTAILESGSGIAVFYARSNNIPTGDYQLKRLEINLTIKEWSV